MKIFAMPLLLISLTGCIMNSGPKENLKFLQVADIQQFNGIYWNIGDPTPLYLSRLIWRDRTTLDVTNPLNIDDKSIDLVQVYSKDSSIKVNLIKGKCIIASREYLLGRDFVLTDGKIILNTEFHPLTRGGVGDVLLGPSYEKIELGIDTKGNGKYKSQGYFAGLVYLVFPMAGSATDEVKFEKLHIDMKFEPCK